MRHPRRAFLRIGSRGRGKGGGRGWPMYCVFPSQGPCWELARGGRRHRRGCRAAPWGGGTSERGGDVVIFFLPAGRIVEGWRAPRVCLFSPSTATFAFGSPRVPSPLPLFLLVCFPFPLHRPVVVFFSPPGPGCGVPHQTIRREVSGEASTSSPNGKRWPSIPPRGSNPAPWPPGQGGAPIHPSTPPPGPSGLRPPHPLASTAFLG